MNDDLNAAKHTHHEQAADEIAFAKANNLAAARRGATTFAVTVSVLRSIHLCYVDRVEEANVISSPRYIVGEESTNKKQSAFLRIGVLACEHLAPCRL